MDDVPSRRELMICRFQGWTFTSRWGCKWMNPKKRPHAYDVVRVCSSSLSLSKGLWKVPIEMMVHKYKLIDCLDQHLYHLQTSQTSRIHQWTLQLNHTSCNGYRWVPNIILREMHSTRLSYKLNSRQIKFVKCYCQF